MRNVVFKKARMAKGAASKIKKKGMRWAKGVVLVATGPGLRSGVH